ncbi:MAG: FAD-binding protein, partial [Actinobacteria bacterium]|nr:FAD-binding protein [Actinomycetota bacterium]
MSADRFTRELVGAIGREKVLTAVEDLACYAYDATPAAPRIYPAAVVFPACTGEVAAVVWAAAAHRVPVVARGAGTSLSGGALPVDGAVVLSLAGMDAILDLDAENMVAVVQPGLVVAELVAAAERAGLLYPPDPASVAMATMGGSVAECAGGLRGLKYGVTRDYVIGLEVVLADGSVARFGGRTVKNVSGYDMIRLFVGSEGTLGVVTEITV